MLNQVQIALSALSRHYAGKLDLSYNDSMGLHLGEVVQHFTGTELDFVNTDVFLPLIADEISEFFPRYRVESLEGHVQLESGIWVCRDTAQTYGLSYRQEGTGKVTHWYPIAPPLVISINPEDNYS